MSKQPQESQAGSHKGLDLGFHFDFFFYWRAVQLLSEKSAARLSTAFQSSLLSHMLLGDAYLISFLHPPLQITTPSLNSAPCMRTT